MMESITTVPNHTEILTYVHEKRGLLWEKIADFCEEFKKAEGVLQHHTEAMIQSFPVKHHLENGLYTREVFMPKGHLCVSFIHKQTHPGFFLSGEMSVLMDTGEIKRMKAPMKVITEIGTQRIGYMHEDCVWVCVYRTDKETIEEAEEEVYTLNYRELPEYVIINKKLLCQE